MCLTCAFIFFLMKLIFTRTFDQRVEVVITLFVLALFTVTPSAIVPFITY